ncbi:MAG: anaerobic carbon-monoxide dehydrogenase catalytic subunit [Lentisphaerota bacterium]
MCDKTHDHDHDHPHTHSDGAQDYVSAVNEYRKTFPSKQDVIAKTPDKGVREMLLAMDQMGCENSFDRFDKQKPQCNFGMAGVCCRICCMGPCKVTAKAPKGVCGADAHLIVARNMLRSIAAGTAAHGAHGREMVIALRKAAAGELNLPIVGKDLLYKCCAALGIKTENKSLKDIVFEFTDILLDDMSRSKPEKFKLIEAFASEERKKVWKDMDIIPISAYHEVFEALHRTNCGTDGDWENVMKQFGRCGLAFLFNGVLTPALASDILLGGPVRRTARTNIGALKKGFVNIAVHGHLPTIVSEIIKFGRSEEFINMAKTKGALGIEFYGICCTGLSAMYRYGNVIPLSNAVGAELVLGTGALDLWVADIQDVFPGIMEVARCFKTTVVTTSDSARLPGAEHYGYDRYHTNMGETEAIARKIVTRAIESFAARRDVPVTIPPYEVEAEVGFSPEHVEEKYGYQSIVEAMKDGRILGIVNMVGCTNPRVIFEKAIVDISEKLIANNVLILTNGCASFPLLKLGFCSKGALDKTGAGLKGFLKDEPPVWHMGECIDNAKCAEVFGKVAGAAGKAIKDMPYAFSSPEWSNEKGVGASYAFRLNGMSSFHCVYPPVQGSDKVMEFIFNAKDTLGSTMTVDPNPDQLADKMLQCIKDKRKELGWDK